METHEMKPSKVKIALSAYVGLAVAGGRPAPLGIEGPPGVGKSQIADQVIAEHGLYFTENQEVRLGDRDPIDLRGVPCPPIMPEGFDPARDELGATLWPRPDFFPPEILPDGYTHSVVKLEEYDKGTPAMKNLFLQVLLDRRLGAHRLPDHCIIMLMGNRAEDRAGSTGGKNWAFQNRVTWITLDPDLSDTLAWQSANDVHPYIGAYLQYAPEAHYTLDPKSKDRQFASPRSWAECDNILQMEVPSDIRRDLLVGAIGPHGVPFHAFVEKATSLPDLDDVFTKPMEAGVVDAADTKWLVVGAVAKNADPSNMREACQYMARYSQEWQANFIREINRREDAKAFKAVKEFAAMRVAVADLIIEVA
jgi:hypothetical protein